MGWGGIHKKTDGNPICFLIWVGDAGALTAAMDAAAGGTLVGAAVAGAVFAAAAIEPSH